MLTIDEAIIHCEEVAKKKKEEANALRGETKGQSIERRDCLECAEEHLQLASWLRELKQFRAESARMVDDGK